MPILGTQTSVFATLCFFPKMSISRKWASVHASVLAYMACSDGSDSTACIMNVSLQGWPCSNQPAEGSHFKSLHSSFFAHFRAQRTSRHTCTVEDFCTRKAKSQRGRSAAWSNFAPEDSDSDSDSVYDRLRLRLKTDRRRTDNESLPRCRAIHEAGLASSVLPWRHSSPRQIVRIDFQKVYQKLIPSKPKMDAGTAEQLRQAEGLHPGRAFPLARPPSKGFSCCFTCSCPCMLV
jgi:hypothetical protein